MKQGQRFKTKSGLDFKTPKNIKIGRIGEDLAVRFLVKHGFRIIERNYWKKWGELDIVAEKKKRIHFVEVKCVSCLPAVPANAGQAGETKTDNVSRETFNRGLTLMVRPEENVTHEKLSRLSRAIQTYLIERKVSQETPYQLDVVTVRLNLKDKTAKVGFIQNVL